MRSGGDSQEGKQLYDAIGATYTVTRRTEPRIAAQVWAALGDARTALHDGAGADSVGLRRRLLRGLLAPARGVPGRERPSRNIGVGQRRAGRRAEGSAQPP